MAEFAVCIAFRPARVNVDREDYLGGRDDCKARQIGEVGAGEDSPILHPWQMEDQAVSCRRND